MAATVWNLLPFSDSFDSAALAINKIDIVLNFIQLLAIVMVMAALVREIVPKPRKTAHPLALLPEEDIDFVLQFVLASGSLKDMASLYGVSYPTIRANLDRVIESVRQRLNGQHPDPMTNLLADLVERGEIKVATAKNIRAVHRAALDKEKD